MDLGVEGFWLFLDSQTLVYYWGYLETQTYKKILKIRKCVGLVRSDSQQHETFIPSVIIIQWDGENIFLLSRLTRKCATPWLFETLQHFFANFWFYENSLLNLSKMFLDQSNLAYWSWFPLEIKNKILDTRCHRHCRWDFTVHTLHIDSWDSQKFQGFFKDHRDFLGILANPKNSWGREFSYFPNGIHILKNS